MDKKKSKYDVDIPKEVLDAFARVLSSIFRKNISAKMKSSAGKSGEGAAKPRLFAL